MKGLFDPDGNFLSSDGTYNFHHKYKLPDGLKGDLILLQWYYLTGNSCTAKGYDTYPFPDGFDPGVAECVGEIPPDGRGVPEQFWSKFLLSFCAYDVSAFTTTWYLHSQSSPCPSL